MPYKMPDFMMPHIEPGQTALVALDLGANSPQHPAWVLDNDGRSIDALLLTAGGVQLVENARHIDDPDLHMRPEQLAQGIVGGVWRYSEVERRRVAMEGKVAALEAAVAELTQRLESNSTATTAGPPKKRGPGRPPKNPKPSDD